MHLLIVSLIDFMYYLSDRVDSYPSYHRSTSDDVLDSSTYEGSCSASLGVIHMVCLWISLHLWLQCAAADTNELDRHLIAMQQFLCSFFMWHSWRLLLMKSVSVNSTCFKRRQRKMHIKCNPKYLKRFHDCLSIYSILTE